MAGEQNKRPSPTPSDESSSSKRAKALLLPASPCSPMPGVVVKKEPGEGRVAMGGRGSSLARAAAEQQGDSAVVVEQPRFNPSIEIQLFHCAVAGCFNPLTPPVYKCEAGHRLCHNCRREGQCRNCNRATTFVHCPDVDEFIGATRVPCPYESSGCGFSVLYHEILEHRDACAYAPCRCLVPDCAFEASPPALRDHLAGEHGWAVDRFAAYAKAHTLRVPAAEPHRLVVVDGDEPRLFLLSLRRRGVALAVSVACVRKSDAAGPDYKCCLWACAPTPPDARRQMERRVMMETDVESCAAPGGPALDNGMWMDVMPEMLLGPSREVQLRIRIDEIRPASASARSANAPPGFR